MANIMASPSRYVQGAGELKKLCEHVKLLGSKLFVLTSPTGKGRVEADLAASAGGASRWTRPGRYTRRSTASAA